MTTAVRPAALASGFLRSADAFPERPALEVGGAVVSYAELRARAAAVAAALAVDAPSQPPLTAVFASRSVDAYAAVLGTLLHGHGYVPLDPAYPVERNRAVLARTGCRSILVDPEVEGAARAVLAGMERPPVVICPDGAEAEPPEPDDADRPAYVLFTSGSTGRPKGVPVRQAHVRAFVDAVSARYRFDEHDRFSQMFDLTFDLHAFDLFVAWEHGACVCCPTPGERLQPSSFIRGSRLSVWFSVPSAAMFLERFRRLVPGAFPDLRLSLFCGEALPVALAQAWQLAAPGSTVENLYGPTEATIACTAHRLDCEASGLVPIGRPLGETRIAVLDEALRPVGPGEEGELVLAGPQVVDGYLDDEPATARAFLSLPGIGHAYRTGDRVVAAPDGTLTFVGRLDTQIKVLGHRVELEEVEAAIHEEAGAEALALGWPRTETGAAGVVALVAGEVDPPALRARLAARLPAFMVPREIRPVRELPRTPNGKRDRNAAAALWSGKP